MPHSWFLEESCVEYFLLIQLKGLKTPRERKLWWKKYFTLSWPRKCLSEARTCTSGTAVHQPGQILLLHRRWENSPRFFCPTFINCFYPLPHGSVEPDQLRHVALPSRLRALHAEGQLYGIFLLISNRIRLALFHSGFSENAICTAADPCGTASSWNVITWTKKYNSTLKNATEEALVRFRRSWLAWKSKTLKIAG